MANCIRGAKLNLGDFFKGNNIFDGLEAEELKRAFTECSQQKENVLNILKIKNIGVERLTNGFSHSRRASAESATYARFRNMMRIAE
jgi:hypothetical protein